MERFNETDNKESSVDRKAEAEAKIEKYNNQIDDTVKAHGEMLKNRRDLSPEEKMEMQAEITENAKKSKEEFRTEMEKEYPELKDSEKEKNEKDDIEKAQNDIGDEL